MTEQPIYIRWENRAPPHRKFYELEVELTLEELAEILGEELELPNIKPRGREKIESKKIKYSGIGKGCSLYHETIDGIKMANQIRTTPDQTFCPRKTRSANIGATQTIGATTHLPEVNRLRIANSASNRKAPPLVCCEEITRLFLIDFLLLNNVTIFDFFGKS